MADHGVRKLSVCAKVYRYEEQDGGIAYLVFLLLSSAIKFRRDIIRTELSTGIVSCRLECWLPTVASGRGGVG